MTEERGQLVVLAAAALALALAPMALAYLQLGYHADAQAEPDRTTLADAERTLARALVDATDGLSGRFDWGERSTAVRTLGERLDPSLDALRGSGLDSGAAVRVTYNDSRAQVWAADNCPSGPDRAFGPCRADRGVVVQERDGETHVLGVAVDVSITTPDGERSATRLVTAPAGRRAGIRT